MARTNTEVTLTRGEFEKNIDLIAQFQLDIDRLTVERDEAKEAILRKYNTQISSLNSEIKALQTEAQTYAKLNWSRLAPSPNAKTAETPLASYGFRTGQPTPKALTKKKEADLAEQLYNDGLKDYVNVKFKLNKTAIVKALRAGVEAITKLFKLNQAERFYVEAKASNGK